MSGSIAPFPSIVPPGEAYTTATAVDGTRLFVRSRMGPNGMAGVRTIFCDGILCEGFIWKYLWQQVSKITAVTHWNYRGHGRSGLPVDPERISLAAHAEDLMSVRQHEGDPPCVLVGHSMGTQVCLENYHLFPNNVRGLILICGSYGKVTSSFRGVPILDFVLPKVMELAEKRPELVRAFWSRIPPEIALKLALRAGDIDHERIHPEDMLPYLQHMTHVDFPLFLKMLRSAGDHTAEGYMSKINVPTLIIAGERDTFTPASLSSYMAETIPNSELVTIERGTHVAPIEQPEVVEGIIKDFLHRRVLV